MSGPPEPRRPSLEDTAAPVTAPAGLEDTAIPDTAPSGLEETGAAALVQTGAAVSSLRTATRATPLGRGASFGRYLVLDKLGAGGMGVVYAAYDPELDRKVALKLLLADHKPGSSHATEGRIRLLREAQAMAKLSHPNVIAVHDVGTLGDQVFVAMEFVDGQTLRGWMREQPRSWRDVVDVFTRAGRGLVAAHTVGLVHRDFKPDNVMIDRVVQADHSHGRVRVMDFGLARPTAAFEAGAGVDPSASGALSIELTQQGAMVGTPAYMAPEQIRGETSDARIDQFAFCIALWEALFGQRPFLADSLAALVQRILSGEITPPPRGSRVPQRIRRILARGLAIDPAERWPDMQALLAELARDPARARRRWIAVGTVGAIAVGALAWQRIDRARVDAACVAEGRAIDELWNDSRRDEVQQAFLGTAVAHATESWERLQPWLDDYAAGWATMRTDACRATAIDARRSPDALASTRECLDERRLAFGQFVDVLATPDVETVRRSIGSAAGLPRLDACIDDRWLVQRVRLPDDPEVRAQVLALRERASRASALAQIGRYQEAIAIGEPLVDEARALQWEPLVGELQLALGNIRELAGDYAGAEASLRAAYLTAGATAADDIAAHAASALVGVVGDRLARHADAQEWVDYAWMVLTRNGQADGTLDAAHLHSDAGVLQHARGEYDQALAEYEQALAIYEPMLGGDHPSVAETIGDIGLVYFKRGEFDRAIEYLGREVEIHERALGPNHPDAANTMDELAAAHHLARNLDEALALHRRALAIRERNQGPDHPEVALSLNNLGNVEQSRGDLEAALASYSRAQAIWERALGPEHPDVAASLYNLARLHLKRKAPDEALAAFQRSLAIADLALGAEHPHVAYPLVGIGLVLLDLGRASEAIAPFERAVKLRDRKDGDPNELAEAKYALARALWDGSDRHAQAVALARDAEQAWAASGEAGAEDLVDLRKWLQQHSLP